MAGVLKIVTYLNEGLYKVVRHDVGYWLAKITQTLPSCENEVHVHAASAKNKRSSATVVTSRTKRWCRKQLGGDIPHYYLATTSTTQTLYISVEVWGDSIQSPLQLTITSEHILIHSFLITAQAVMFLLLLLTSRSSSLD